MKIIGDSINITADLSIGRDNQNRIMVSLEDKASGVIFARGFMSPEDLAFCLTGQARPVAMELNALRYVGAKRESQELAITMPNATAKHDAQALDFLHALYPADTGWVMRKGDWSNHHRIVKRTEKTLYYQQVMWRWIGPDGKPIPREE